MKNTKRLWTIGVIVMLFSSCEKDNKQQIPDSNDSGNAYVLNEGIWGGNDAELSFLSTQTGDVTNNYFSLKNGRGLGDVANDIAIYGNKIYIVVNTSNTVEIVDKKSGKSLQRLSLSGKSPRYITFYEGYAYVSCYDKSIVKIDTVTMNISPIGCHTTGIGQCEGICAANGNLYIANGWTKTINGTFLYDSTISVININNFSETKKITIGINPKSIAYIGNNRIMVSCIGNYDNIPSSLAILDLGTETVTKLNIETTSFTIYNNYAFLYNYNWQTSKPSFTKLDLITLTPTHWNHNSSVTFKTPYGISIDPNSEDIYITDIYNFQSNGDVYCFDKNGNLRFKKECGIGPSKVIFL